MKFFISLLIFGVFSITSSLEAPIENDNVELVINGDESELPENILGINVNNFENGAQVKSEKLFPTEELQEEVPEAIIQLPEIAESLPVEVPDVAEALPAEVPDVAVGLPAEIPDIAVGLPAEIPNIVVALPAEIPNAAVALPAEIPDLAVGLPAEVPEDVAVLPVEVPEEIVVLPADEEPIQSLPVAEEGSNIVYKDDLVSVEVNADGANWYSSWVSMVVNWFSGSSEQSTKVL